MADGAEGAGETVKTEKIFVVLSRFNTVAIFLAIILVAAIWSYQYYQAYEMKAERETTWASSGFGAGLEEENSIIGHRIETDKGDIVAYYESDDDYERKENAGLVIVNQMTGKTLPIAAAGEDILVDFEFLFDHGKEGRPVVGYIAKLSDKSRYDSGRADLVVGAIPALTMNVVARDVLFTDIPTVRSDGALAVILWQNQDEAELISFQLTDGAIVDRAKIQLPVLQSNRLSQGPGKSFDAALLRDPSYGVAPKGKFAF